VTKNPIRIARLWDHPDLLQQIAALYTSVWPGWYGPDGPGDAMADLAERSRTNGLPFGLIAFWGERPVGAAALSAHSFGAMAGEGPWLVGLAVDPGARRQGIATHLIARAETEARSQASWLYCTSSAAVTLLARRGWTDQRRAGEGTDRVFRLTL
jgi:GNAT superfamily N-acetyltransferase